MLARTGDAKAIDQPVWLIWSACSSASAISIAAADSEPNTAANGVP